MRKALAYVLFFAPLLAGAQAVNLGPHALKQGEVVILELPLSPANKKLAARGANPKVETAKFGIAVPEAFDPSKSWPVLVVSATADASSIGLMDAYKQVALGKGWVVIAADGPIAPKEDSNDWRYAMLNEGLEHMTKSWPKSNTWPYVCAGFSGGGKRSGYIAALMMKDHYKVAGMCMAGVNQDMATMALNEYHPNASAFRRVPIFLSGGTQDTTATPAAQQHVKKSMTNTGFKKVRLESFSGGHEIHQPHIVEALDWFSAEK